MDLSAYINSGVLELYVLDRLSPGERRRVEAYAEEYPEVRSEIEQIELALEEYSLLRGEATPPNPQVLTNVLSQLQTTTATAPPPPAARRTPPPPPAAPAASGVPAWSLWLLGVLLALALAGLVYFYLQSQDREQQLGSVQSELSVLQDECNQIAADYQADEEQLQVLTDPDTRGIVLAGSDNAPNSRALVFYNQNEGTVLFTASNLPAPPAGKQYQLWAIDAQGPQDLGVLATDLNSDTLLSVPFIPNAAAFAITLEDEGGKPTPDLSQLQVIGNVPS